MDDLVMRLQRLERMYQDILRKLDALEQMVRENYQKVRETSTK